MVILTLIYFIWRLYLRTKCTGASARLVLEGKSKVPAACGKLKFCPFIPLLGLGFEAEGSGLRVWREVTRVGTGLKSILTFLPWKYAKSRRMRYLALLGSTHHRHEALRVQCGHLRCPPQLTSPTLLLKLGPGTPHPTPYTPHPTP